LCFFGELKVPQLPKMMVFSVAEFGLIAAFACFQNTQNSAATIPQNSEMDSNFDCFAMI
jgi:hypothetical protein